MPNFSFAIPKVFISYSHDSREHMNRVLALANRLRAEGVDCNIDQYEESPAEGWPRWMMNQLNCADFVIVVCTEQYNYRFRGKEEPGKGRRFAWEGSIISQELYDSHVKSIKFVPVLFSAMDENYIPLIVRGFSRYLLDTEEGYTALYRYLTNQPLNPKPLLGKQVELPRQNNLVRSIALEHRKYLNKELDNQNISQSLVDSQRLESVFKRSGIPTYTFVEPVDYRRLFVALRTPGIGLVVEGSSGVGKTTSVSKVLDQLAVQDKKIKKLTARKQEDREEIATLPGLTIYDLVIIDDFHTLDDNTKKK